MEVIIAKELEFTVIFEDGTTKNGFVQDESMFGKKLVVYINEGFMSNRALSGTMNSIGKNNLASILSADFGQNIKKLTMN